MLSPDASAAYASVKDKMLFLPSYSFFILVFNNFLKENEMVNCHIKEQ